MNMESNSNVRPSLARPPLVLAVSDPDGGEIGDIYNNVGQKVTYWQGQLHGALTAWLKDADEINMIVQNAIDRFNQDVKMYKWMVGEYKGMQHDHNNDSKKNFVYNFAPSWIAKINQLFSDLGIPQSAIQYKKTIVNGKTMDQFNMTQFGNMLHAAQDGIAQGLANGTIMGKISQVGSQIGQIRSKQTQDMFKVMYCYQSVRSNEKSLSSVMKNLTQIFSNISRNIAS